MIQGFNTFLPVGYRIECSLDGQDRNRITVTTPEGTTTQSTTGAQQVIKIDDAGRLIHFALVLAPDSSPFPVISKSESLPYTHEQISPAMEYVTKIKQRFADHTDQYQEFLDILSLYKRSPVDEVSGTHLRFHQVLTKDLQIQLTNRIAKLFQNSPDLLSDFQVFMPRGVIPNADVLGALDESSAANKLLKTSKSPSKRTIKGADTASAAGSSGAPKRKRRPVAGEREGEKEQEKESKLPQGKVRR